MLPQSASSLRCRAFHPPFKEIARTYVHRNHHLPRHRPAHNQPRLGTLFNASDYPSTLDGLFDLEVSYSTIEPPQFLVALNPEAFQQEQARVRERLESAVDQAFATELQRLTAHLAERLTGLHDSEPKVFRDSAVENLREIEKLQIPRASHVEQPHADGFWWADMGPVGGPVLGAERGWLTNYRQFRNGS